MTEVAISPPHNGKPPQALPSKRVSIVVPIRNEIDGIADALTKLRNNARTSEIIVVDGESSDGTAAVARLLVDQFISCTPGRARQMNAGLALATGDIVLFLHADTVLPSKAIDDILRLCEPDAPLWGRFDVCITGRSALLPIVAAGMNMRSQLTGVATGDQAIFVRRDTLKQIGGIPDLPIMEDVALSKALRKISRPLCLRSRVTTSGRRWDANGLVRTIVIMWGLRLGYVLRVSPDWLASAYAALRRG